jgi:hypothetical protein
MMSTAEVFSQAKIKIVVPDYLIYEVIDGRKLYVKGYEAVLSGDKTTDDIMGASTIQSVVISYFLKLIFRHLDEKRYWFLTNETGLHINHKNNLSNDIAVYERTVLTANNINNKYADVPARLCVEVDIKADLSKVKDFNYVQRKTQKLLNFGTERVIWIFTDTRKILIAEKNMPPIIEDWNNEFEMLDGVCFNIGDYLQSEGIILTGF